jgi:hypothetical protein
MPHAPKVKSVTFNTNERTTRISGCQRAPEPGIKRPSSSGLRNQRGGHYGRQWPARGGRRGGGRTPGFPAGSRSRAPSRPSKAEPRRPIWRALQPGTGMSPAQGPGDEGLAASASPGYERSCPAEAIRGIGSTLRPVSHRARPPHFYRGRPRILTETRTECHHMPKSSGSPRRSSNGAAQLRLMAGETSSDRPPEGARRAGLTFSAAAGRACPTPLGL